MAEVKKKTQIEKKDSFKEGIVNYLKGVKTEWHKVTWPERGQVIAETIVVIGVVLFFTTLVYLIDILFKGLFSIISNKAG
ncbi:MAG: preprotein translocase subunit SecE [Candidatus Gastranaerophilaceae bacterium]|jgi:preprotein translocase subunit SecE